jgi:(p)ppGpp synthase/HD superfamily hydrolase
MSAMVLAAGAFARMMHRGHLDKSGAPYICHLARTANNLTRRWPDATEEEIAAAWLHDVLEDTQAMPSDLLRFGISERAIEIVMGLTLPRGLVYLDWIRLIAEGGDISIIRVKIADNEDNSNPARVAAIADGSRLVAERYRPAREILERALEGHAA